MTQNVQPRDWKTNAWRGLAASGGDRSTLAGPAFWILSLLFLAIAVYSLVTEKWSGVALGVGGFVVFGALHFGVNGLQKYAGRRGGMSSES